MVEDVVQKHKDTRSLKNAY